MRFTGKAGIIHVDDLECTSPCTLDLEPGAHDVRLDDKGPWPLQVRNRPLTVDLHGGSSSSLVTGISILVASGLFDILGVVGANSSNPQDQQTAVVLYVITGFTWPLGLAVTIVGGVVSSHVKMEVSSGSAVAVHPWVAPLHGGGGAAGALIRF